MFVKSYDGVQLRYVVDVSHKPKAVIVINHGFAEHLGRYEYVGKALSQAGYTVYRYDTRGHGQTLNKLGHVTDYVMWIKDCDTMVELAKEQNPDLPVFMLGHSMGGLITAMYGIAYPHSLEGQVFSGPAVSTLPQASAFNRSLLKTMSKVKPDLLISNPVEDAICSDPEVVQNYKNDPLVLRKASVKFLEQFLIAAPKYVQANVQAYTYPCLVLYGTKDTIVPPEVTLGFYEAISSEDKTLVKYDDLYHEILNEPIKDEILADIIAWLNERA